MISNFQSVKKQSGDWRLHQDWGSFPPDMSKEQAICFHFQWKKIWNNVWCSKNETELLYELRAEAWMEVIVTCSLCFLLKRFSGQNL